MKIAFHLFILCLLGGSALAQPMINNIAPATAARGTTGFTVTFTLPSGMPPPPRQQAMPDSVTIGEINGSNFGRPSQTSVTATFDFPGDMAIGDYDVAITFTTPTGELVYNGTAAFSVTSADAPPVVLMQPSSTQGALGGKATFTCEFLSNAPVTYQWQHGEDFVGTDSPTLTLTDITRDNGGAYTCTATNAYGSATTEPANLTIFSDQHLPPYAIVDTNQSTTYGNEGTLMRPQPGDAFAGQDGQYRGNQPFYTVSDDGLTVYDNVTRLTWTQSADTNGDGEINASDKFSLTTVLAHINTLNAASFGGYNDWRLPTIKELYSLMDFTGVDPGLGGMGVTAPFINDDVFDFGYGDVDGGERIIDAQFMSSTPCADPILNGQAGLFGLNLADGRIKGYPLDLAFYIYAVRGNPVYGENQFVDNGDGTITDQATGLMWQQADSAQGMNWQDALAYAEASELAGYRDWRLPNAKELQSLVDYARAPGATASAAIDPIFASTGIINESGVADFPWYWSSTTFVNGAPDPAKNAVYLSFGRAMGFYPDSWQDVHGAGAQRGDPKTGSLDDYTYEPNGYFFDGAPQGDAIRILNYVRCVRGGATPPRTDTDEDGIYDWEEFAYTGDTTSLQPDVDQDGDGQVNLSEIIAGTKLDDPQSFLRVSAVTTGEPGVTLTWPSALDRVYVVSASPDLETFTPVGGEITGEPPLNELTLEPDSYPMFYRIGIAPPNSAGPQPQQ
ncbi:MAG: DUF1566 domain-containing protein [Puniceicoccales bacterium]